MQVQTDDKRTLVLVSHSETLVGFGLAAALGSHPEFSVQVGTFAMAMNEAARFDVIVCDHDAGLRLARAARLAGPARRNTRLLVLTAVDREQAVRQALEAGVQGYMLQGCPVDEFVDGVRMLARGQRCLSLAVAQRMADSITHEPLTAREREVLELLACGECNKSIARELQIAVGTVKAHVKAVMTKLGAGSRTQAVTVAARRGLVSLAAAGADRPTASPMAPRSGTGRSVASYV